MTTTGSRMHRLDGLEPDNFLAFLALLGLLRALEAADLGAVPRRALPRVAWDLENPPLRPVLCLPEPMTREDIALEAVEGLATIARAHDFEGVKNLSYSREECRDVLEREAKAATVDARGRADLLASLMSDGLTKDEKGEPIQPTPLCLQFGQGWQFFLERLAKVPADDAPLTRGRGKARVQVPASQCLAEAIFEPWHRSDATFGFRWDPEDDVRYALMAGDPTDAAYKQGTQHGANRLAAVGLAAVTMAPGRQRGKPRPLVIGGDFRSGFSFAWPVWRGPATLTAIRALLAHPELRTPGVLRHLGVEHVFVARRVSVGKYMNFTRARVLGAEKV